MSRLTMLLVMGATLVLVLGGLDIYQMHRAQAQVETALAGRSMSECTRRSPCIIPSVAADICTLLTSGESFLGRSSGFDAVFTAAAPCQRGRRYRIRFHAHTPD